MTHDNHKIKILQPVASLKDVDLGLRQYILPYLMRHLPVLHLFTDWYVT